MNRNMNRNKNALKPMTAKEAKQAVSTLATVKTTLELYRRALSDFAELAKFIPQVIARIEALSGLLIRDGHLDTAEFEQATEEALLRQTASEGEEGTK